MSAKGFQGKNLFLCQKEHTLFLKGFVGLLKRETIHYIKYVLITIKLKYSWF